MPSEITVPQLGESIVEATIGRWLKHPGDAVAQGDALVELETDKVNLEVQAQESGVLSEVRKAEGDTVTIGEVLGLLQEGGAATTVAAGASAPASQPADASASAPAPAPSPAEEPGGPTSPEVRRLAQDLQVELAQIAGSGPRGRVTREDVLSFAKSRMPQAAVPSPATTTPAPAPSAAPPTPATATASAPPFDETGRREERRRMSRRRLTIARRLVEAQHQAAMLTTFNEVDLSAVMALRKERKDAFKEKHGVSLGFMSFFAKATISALKAFPRLNAEIQGEEIVLKSYYDIGIAVSTDEGLVVPVVRDADRLNFAGLEQAIAALAEKARNGALTLEDLRGGTFTITNGGVFGSLLSTPILNAPQVGILGMHGIVERPIAVKGEVTIRPMMYIALSYDHRIVDGSESVRFLRHIKDCLEDPTQLLLEG
ncbi:MAG: 2-oxoglutarate dehydrogenase complex dihydrolipoyllysine-residue succinyltransferase [Thermaerobacter sp.]|nr:2-oxoglutarate dehydrogenase complex dihydrolipoyllysine-residue succinyltransferase [Thermaerobacter sp.]